MSSFSKFTWDTALEVLEDEVRLHLSSLGGVSLSTSDANSSSMEGMLLRKETPENSELLCIKIVVALE
jgi:hypothetical protein